MHLRSSYFNFLGLGPVSSIPLFINDPKISTQIQVFTRFWCLNWHTCSCRQCQICSVPTPLSSLTNGTEPLVYQETICFLQHVLIFTCPLPQLNCKLLLFSKPPSLYLIMNSLRSGPGSDLIINKPNLDPQDLVYYQM